MATVIMHPESKEQLTALKAFAKALKIKFEVRECPYNPDFVKKILKSHELAKKGLVIKLDPCKSLWGNLM